MIGGRCPPATGKRRRRQLGAQPERYANERTKKASTDLQEVISSPWMRTNSLAQSRRSLLPSFRPECACAVKRDTQRGDWKQGWQ